jgi:hypothetical protein
VEHIKEALVGLALGFTYKYKARLERLARDEHSSLFASSLETKKKKVL